MRAKLTRKAQSTLEYAILILIVIVALLAMQVYLKRGIQGRMRESSENIGQAYSPGYTTSNFHTELDSVTLETVKDDITTTTLQKRDEQRDGNENVAASTSEYWPG